MWFMMWSLTLLILLIFCLFFFFSFFFFFFFKQKTAYEMCGRDWSSDVCSSDLVLLAWFPLSRLYVPQILPIMEATCLYLLHVSSSVLRDCCRSTAFTAFLFTILVVVFSWWTANDLSRGDSDIRRVLQRIYGRPSLPPHWYHLHCYVCSNISCFHFITKKLFSDPNNFSQE